MKKEKLNKDGSFWIKNDIDEISVIANKLSDYRYDDVISYKISFLNIRYDCKRLKLYADDKEFYYCLTKKDNFLPVSRITVESAIGSENLILAEKQVLKNMKILSRELKVSLESDFMKSITGIVNQFVKYYRSDWYYIDNYYIRKHNISKFILCARDSGTHLLPLLSDIDYSDSNNNMLEYFIKNSDSTRKYFLCDSDDRTIKQITLNDVIHCIKF